MSSAAAVLKINAASIEFQNPVLLAAGTAGYGRELASIMDLDNLGGIVTKAVSPEPRKGAPAPRVAEFDGGMINAVGLANPGLEAVRRDDLPWLSANVRAARVIVNVVGNAVEDFATVVESLDEFARVDAFELNVSCPNVRQGGMEFGADHATLSALIAGARSSTRKPLFVKLSPTLPSIGDTARAAVDAGADGLTLINTIPGLVIDVDSRRPALGFGSGGVSGVGLLPVGVLAVWEDEPRCERPSRRCRGVSSGKDVVRYLLAGASLVGVGTAAMRDPRAPERILRELSDWMNENDIGSPSELIGRLEWQS